jgi:hypothetical protein
MGTRADLPATPEMGFDGLLKQMRQARQVSVRAGEGRMAMRVRMTQSIGALCLIDLLMFPAANLRSLRSRKRIRCSSRSQNGQHISDLRTGHVPPVYLNRLCISSILNPVLPVSAMATTYSYDRMIR